MDKVQVFEPLERFGKVTVVNDCTSAAAGEFYYGDLDSENMVYVTISSGIGAGAVIDGAVVEGWRGNFGELGHMVVGSHSLECGCGGTDHWEAYCSGNRMPRMAEETLGYSFRDSRQIFENYQEGDEKAEEVIEEMKRYNCIGFSNLVDIFNPEVVWVGGAVALNHYDVVVEDVLEDVESQTANDMPDFRKCSLGQEAVIRGLRAACNGKFSP